MTNSLWDEQRYDNYIHGRLKFNFKTSINAKECYHILESSDLIDKSETIAGMVYINVSRFGDHNNTSLRFSVYVYENASAIVDYTIVEARYVADDNESLRFVSEQSIENYFNTLFKAEPLNKKKNIENDKT